MYRVAICDDEPIVLKDLYQMTRGILSEMGVEHCIQTFSNTNALQKEIFQNPQQFQILLLDILMEKNGVAFARELRARGNGIGIVFVTGSRDYCLEGYDVYPLHYLMKPIQKKSLFEVLLRDYEQNFRAQKISIPTKGETLLLRVDAIFYIELLNRSLIFHTVQGTVTSSGTFKKLEGFLPPNTFLRCHKSFLVNKNKVTGFSRNALLMGESFSVPIGRAYHHETLTSLIAYWNG